MWLLLGIYVASVIFSYRICSKNERIHCLAKGIPYKVDSLMVVFSLIPIANIAFLGVISELDDAKSKIRSATREANAISKCPNCMRHSRKYQSVLHKLDARINGKIVGNCPHCDAVTNLYYGAVTGDEHAWQANHPDCPKLSKRGLVEYLKTRRDIEAIVTQMESFEALERYEKTRRKRNEQR